MKKDITDGGNNANPTELEIKLVQKWLDNGIKNSKETHPGYPIPGLKMGNSPHYLQMTYFSTESMIQSQVILNGIVDHLSKINFTFGNKQTDALARPPINLGIGGDESVQGIFGPIHLSMLASLASYHASKDGYSVDSDRQLPVNDLYTEDIYDCFLFLTESKEGAKYFSRIFANSVDLIRGANDLEVR